MNYIWTPAVGYDVDPIVKLAQTHFENEIDMFFRPEPITYSRNITLAVVNQFYIPASTLLTVAKSDNKLFAYTWANCNERNPWSDDPMVFIKMAHVDMTLPIRTRLKLIVDMFAIWENFAKLTNNKIICSTTMRKDQDGFLRLHQNHGYEVRGSYAYKKVDTTQATPAN